MPPKKGAHLVGQEDPTSLINRRVAKEFEGEMYEGTVTQYYPDTKWWHVDYDDGDGEDYSISEINKLLLPLGGSSSRHAAAAAAPAPPKPKAAPKPKATPKKAAPRAKVKSPPAKRRKHGVPAAPAAAPASAEDEAGDDEGEQEEAAEVEQPMDEDAAAAREGVAAGGGADEAEEGEQEGATEGGGGAGQPKDGSPVTAVSPVTKKTKKVSAPKPNQPEKPQKPDIDPATLPKKKDIVMPEYDDAPVVDDEWKARRKENAGAIHFYYKMYQLAKASEQKRVAESGGVRKDGKRQSQRPDLVAFSAVKDQGKKVLKDKKAGALKGIRVGEQYYGRCEMQVVGMHHHWLAGIDFTNTAAKDARGKKVPQRSYGTCVVISGNYEDDVDGDEDKDVVVYTGQGGNDLLHTRRQIASQRLVTGNLALVGNHDLDIPVRLVRKNDEKSSYTDAVYTYDGLYDVTKYWKETGVSGFYVYKYQLTRRSGQPRVTSKSVHWGTGQNRTSFPQKFAPSQRVGCVMEDMSLGQEAVPVVCVNQVDDEPPPTALKPGSKYKGNPEELGRSAFYYVTKPVYGKSIPVPKSAKVHKDGHVPHHLNGDEGLFPYVRMGKANRLTDSRDAVYECGPDATCKADCAGRLVQHGLQTRLEVFRTKDKGWGVRSWDFIPQGSFVCEFTGDVMTVEEADRMAETTDMSYIFNLDCIQTAEGEDGRQARGTGLKHMSEEERSRAKSGPAFAIDGEKSGSVARFINHSCEPNLFIQCTLIEHHDLRLPRIALFAWDNIAPMTELTYDYGEEYVTQRLDPGCRCGATECRKPADGGGGGDGNTETDGGDFEEEEGGEEAVDGPAAGAEEGEGEDEEEGGGEEGGEGGGGDSEGEQEELE